MGLSIDFMSVVPVRDPGRRPRRAAAAEAARSRAVPGAGPAYMIVKYTEAA